MSWYSRAVLAWKLSTTLDTAFCIDVLNEVLEKYGNPEIFNTDQGCQFTCEDFTTALKKRNIQISMDGKGRALDNVFVERLWRTVKYDNIFIRGYETVTECREGLTEYIDYYNNRREHSSLRYNYPMEIYTGRVLLQAA